MKETEQQKNKTQLKKTKKKTTLTTLATLPPSSSPAGYLTRFITTSLEIVMQSRDAQSKTDSLLTKLASEPAFNLIHFILIDSNKRSRRSFIGFFWLVANILGGFGQNYQDPPSYARISPDLLSSFKIPQDSPKFIKIHQDSSRFTKIHQDSTRFAYTGLDPLTFIKLRSDSPKTF